MFNNLAWILDLMQNPPRLDRLIEPIRVADSFCTM
jgi:hypothetical protein